MSYPFHERGEELKFYNNLVWILTIFKPQLKICIFICTSWLHGLFWEWWSVFFNRGRPDLHDGTNMWPLNTPTFFFCFHIYSLRWSNCPSRQMSPLRNIIIDLCFAVGGSMTLFSHVFLSRFSSGDLTQDEDDNREAALAAVTQQTPRYDGVIPGTGGADGAAAPGQQLPPGSARPGYARADSAHPDMSLNFRQQQQQSKTISAPTSPSRWVIRKKGWLPFFFLATIVEFKPRWILKSQNLRTGCYWCRQG